MHHLVFGTNFQIHSVSLSILVSIHLLIHFSTHLCHHPHSRHPSLLHSFTPGSKPTFSTSPSHRNFYGGGKGGRERVEGAKEKGEGEGRKDEAVWRVGAEGVGGEGKGRGRKEGGNEPPSRNPGSAAVYCAYMSKIKNLGNGNFLDFLVGARRGIFANSKREFPVALVDAACAMLT